MDFEEFREPTKKERRIRDYSYRKALEGVFDAKTIEAIEKLIASRVIEDIYYPVSTGKEADVYYAKSPKGEELAVKIYRIHTSAFKKIDIYVIQDKRFQARKSPIKQKWAWARREFKNLKLAYNAGVHVPKPIRLFRNVLVMQFIGRNGTPAPQLVNVEELVNPEYTFKVLINDVKLMFQKAKLVHADLSPFNILILDKKEPYIIDMAQGVRVSHPYALQFLYRDIHHIVSFFKGFLDETPDIDDIFEEITGEKPSILVKSILNEL